MNLNTAKIVGTANEAGWSQVHIFRPEVEAKLNSYGELLAALSFKAKQELDIDAFGLEIVKRLQEIYYSNEAESVLIKLSQALETLAAEFLDQVTLEVSVMVVWQDYLYAGRFGQSQVWLKRGDNLVKLLASSGEGTATVSGKLQPGDRLVATTSQFNQLVAEGALKGALSQETVALAGEILAAQVHGHEDNSLAAAVIAQAGEAEPKVEVPPPGKKTQPLRLFLKKCFTLVQKRFPRRKIEVFVGSEKKRRSALTLGLILVLIFTASVVLAGRKKQAEQHESAYRTLLEELNYKLSEAEGLLTLNPLRAKTLLAESQERLNAYLSQPKTKETEELSGLKQRLTAALGQVEREYRFESADEWYDFDLIKDGFRGSVWGFNADAVLIYDPATVSVVTLKLANKEAAIVGSGETLAGANAVGLTDNRGFVVTQDKAVVVDTDKEKILSETEADGWQRVIKAVGFGSNLYLLDAAQNGQIWKYLGLEEGLSTKREYLKIKEPDLSEAVDMAIDGTVWVLFSDGSIAKYTQGVKDTFSVVGIDQPVAGNAKIFTGPEADNVYLLDAANTRVVVLTKTGEYQAQYIWPGIAGVRDFAVSEELGKIFFLTGEKVFTLGLK